MYVLIGKEKCIRCGKYNIIIYVLIGKEKCIHCDKLKNLLDEKTIQYHYLDMMEMPRKTMTYLRMYCNSYPMVLSVSTLVLLMIH